MPEYARVTYEDYTALYEDGKLIQWNDNYIVDDYIFHNLLGGQTLPSAPLYERADTELGGQAPETLDEYRKWIEEYEESDDA